MDEETRVKLIANDDDAWRVLVEEYRPCVRAIVARRVKPFEIDDLVDQVIARVFMKFSQQRVRGHFKNWVARLAQNIVNDFLRKQRGLETSIEGIDVRDPAESVYHKLADIERHKELEQKLQSLTPLQRAVILRRARGMCYSDIANQLGIDKTKASNCFSRAVRKLRKGRL